MMTPSHVLISCGLLARQGKPWRNLAAAAGGLLPDVPMFALFAWDRLVEGLPEHVIWGERYWSDDWQIPVAISHSIPIYAVVLALGLWWRSEIVKVYALSTFLHIACDLPVHHDDAHMHLWPLSRWRFISPVSYWDPSYHGALMSKIELAIVLVMIVLLWRRFSSTWTRVACALALAMFVAVPLYFSLTHYDPV